MVEDLHGYQIEIINTTVGWNGSENGGLMFTNRIRKTWNSELRMTEKKLGIGNSSTKRRSSAKLVWGSLLKEWRNISNGIMSDTDRTWDLELNTTKIKD